MKVSLTGPVQLELIERACRENGVELACLGDIPDFTWNVTSKDRELAKEVPGFYDERLEKLAGCPYSLAGIEAHVEELQWAVVSPKRLGFSGKKILAVDADNTLWRGILSEDGPDGLVACEIFQRGLRELRDRGVVIVLLTKNDGEGFFDSVAMRNPLVTEGLFADARINWSPKPGNLMECCRELGLGVDSVVFLDDNPFERKQMAAHLPEVAVAPWTGWSDASAASQRQLLRRLEEYFFYDAGRTEEDRLRADDYRHLAQARALSVSCATRDDYLKGLGLWVEPRLAAEGDLDRLVQMAGKTNQFNATTIRRKREEFAALIGPSSEAKVYVFRAGDCFGEQGIVCYIIVHPAERRITDFVMSCRAMGRTLEHFSYRYVCDCSGARLSVDFIPSAKNRPFESFLREIGSGAELKTYYVKTAGPTGF